MTEAVKPEPIDTTGAPGGTPVAVPDVAAASIPPAAAPAQAAPVAAPPAEASASAGVPDAKPAEAAPETPPTLLATFDADKAAKDAAAAEKAKADAEAAKAKPAETKPADPAKPADPTGQPVATDPAKPAAEAAPAEVKYEFKVPDTIKADHPRMETFTALLRDTKAAPETGQKFLDMAHEVMSEYATQLRADQYSAFNETRAGWRKSVMADPELGGAGHQTALAAAARMRDLLISSHRPGTKGYERDLKEFQDFDRATGASDHPALLRLLHNAARYLDEPQATSLPRDIKPPKGNGRPPKGSIYTHASSANMDKL